MAIPTALRQQVMARAKLKCEYCCVHQDFSIYTHEIDHTIALKHGGKTIAENLALACLSCNRHKGSDLTSLDPVSGDITPLFNPRRHQWSQHFQLQDAQILGITDIGRTTVFLLHFNTPEAIFSRQLLIAQNCYL
jgi:5-methylcytosine-specific restriction endonuclease McrA